MNFFLTIMLSLFIIPIGNSQELVNFFLSPNNLTSDASLTLHTSFYHNYGAGITGYDYSLDNNVLTVSLCYNLSSTTVVTNDKQFIPISIPLIDGEYVLNVDLYTSDPNGNSCNFTYLSDSGSSTFSVPYNPTAVTIIPDINFETFIENLYYGDGIVNNNSVFTHKIENLTRLIISSDYLEAQGLEKIENLTGIEDFISIRTLNIYNNLIESLDVSNNLDLSWFTCSQNPIKSLDFQNNSQLKKLFCGDPLLNSINLTNTTLLEHLKITDSNLTNLDISNSINLNILELYSNDIEQIDVSNNTQLNSLQIAYTPLVEINLSNNYLLEYLTIRNTFLEEIDLTNNTLLNHIDLNDNEISSITVFDLPLLTSFLASNNHFDSLDLSTSINLEQVLILYNTLTYLNIKNGNNHNLELNSFFNEYPLCIEVDNENEAPYSNWIFSSTTTFSENCLGFTVSPDIINKTSLLTPLFLYPNPTSNILFLETQNALIKKVKIINSQGVVVKQEQQLGTYQIDISQLNSGLYFVSVSLDEDTTLIKKFIKN